MKPLLSAAFVLLTDLEAAAQTAAPAEPAKVAAALASATQEMFPRFPSDDSARRARALMALDAPLLRATARMEKLSLEGANTEDDIQLIVWLLDTARALKIDTSRLAGIIVTSKMPALGMFADVRRQGEPESAVRRVVMLDRANGTALAYLTTFLHECTHDSDSNRLKAEANTLASDSRLALALLPYIDEAALQWPEARPKFRIRDSLAFYDTRGTGVVGWPSLSPRMAFWLRQGVNTSVASFLLLHGPTSGLMSPDHNVVIAELNRLLPQVGEHIYRLQQVHGLAAFSVEEQSGNVTIVFRDERGRPWRVNTGIPVTNKASAPPG